MCVATPTTRIKFGTPRENALLQVDVFPTVSRTERLPIDKRTLLVLVAILNAAH